MRLSHAQRRMLENVQSGRNPGHGFTTGTYASQGTNRVMGSLLHHGLVTMTGDDVGPAFVLTDEGIASLR